MRVVRKALTFDDVLLVPAHSSIVPRDVSLETRLTRTITLKIPLVSAAMDTVTEARLAIALAQEGGLGIVHKNMPLAMQAAEVAKVKRFESGVVKDPLTIPPTMSVRDVLALKRAHRFSGLPVVEGKRVVGIVTNRDLRFETNLDQPVANIMTKRERLVTVPEGADLEMAKELMHRHRLERVLVVNDAMELRGLVTVKDILKATEHPNACKDEQGRLRVGAAVGVAERQRGARRGAGRGGRRRHRRRHRARPFAGRARARRMGEEDLPAGAGHRRQHRHRRGREGAGRPWRGCGEGRHRPRIDLHDAHRRRRRRAADHRRSSSRSKARPRRASRRSPTAACATRATSPRRSPPARRS